MERVAEVFGRPAQSDPPQGDLKVPHAKIGELALENDYLGSALAKASLLSVKR